MILGDLLGQISLQLRHDSSSRLSPARRYGAAM
jgi:hypothetical protein